MECIALCAFQPVSAQAAVIFHVSDRRFDGAEPSNIALEPCGDATLEFAVIELDPNRDGGAAIAQVHEHFFRLPLCQVFHLFQGRMQRMSVVGIARQALHAHHQPFLVCRGY